MKFILALICICSAALLIYFQYPKQVNSLEKPWPELGTMVHTHNGVPIYSNGENYTISHGKHYATDGYYYGHKWQCVEYVKRYYHDAHQHHMPDVWGHAKSFFDPTLGHGELNTPRGMVQYHNQGTEPPQVDDLLVWGSESSYGHVAIISKVEANSVTIVQQNVKNRPTQKLSLTKSNNSYQLGEKSKKNLPLGWLRIP